MVVRRQRVKVATNICDPQEGTLSFLILLTPRIWQQLIDLCKICALLIRTLRMHGTKFYAVALEKANSHVHPQV